MLPASLALPNICPDTLAAFNIVMNCSLALALVESFHTIVILAKLFPELSLTSSVVDTDVNFKSPVAGRFLLAL